MAVMGKHHYGNVIKTHVYADNVHFTRYQRKNKKLQGGQNTRSIGKPKITPVRKTIKGHMQNETENRNITCHETNTQK